MASKLDSIARRIEQLEARSSRDELEKICSDVNLSLARLETQASHLTAIPPTGDQTIGSEDSRVKATTDSHVPALLDMAKMLSNLRSEMLKHGRYHTFIQTLDFQAVKQRRDSIPSAHQATCMWLFDSQRTSYKQWLQNGEGIFWISGLVRTD